MGEIPGSGLQEPALNASEQITNIADHLWRLWAMLNGALSVANQPVGGESGGDVYIVGDTPAGSFSTFDADDVAILIANAWVNLPPNQGWKIWVKDEGLYRRYREETSSTSYDESGWIIDDPDKVYQSLVPASYILVDWSLGSTAYCLLDRATTTFGFTRAYAGQRCILVLEQDGPGGRDAAFGSEVRGGTDTPVPVTLTVSGGEVDYLGFIFNGTDEKFDHVSIAKGFS